MIIESILQNDTNRNTERRHGDDKLDNIIKLALYMNKVHICGGLEYNSMQFSNIS